jgi:hypothetical protein
MRSGSSRTAESQNQRFAGLRPWLWFLGIGPIVRVEQEHVLRERRNI